MNDLTSSLPLTTPATTQAIAVGGSVRDEALVALTARMARQDEAAFAEFLAAYRDRLFRYVIVLTRGDEETAQEALQLTMLRVVRHIRRFEEEAVFWSWLTRLARSAVTDDARKRNRYFAFLSRFFRQPEAHAPPSMPTRKVRPCSNAWNTCCRNLRPRTPNWSGGNTSSA